MARARAAKHRRPSSRMLRTTYSFLFLEVRRVEPLDRPFSCDGSIRRQYQRPERRQEEQLGGLKYPEFSEQTSRACSWPTSPPALRIASCSASKPRPLTWLCAEIRWDFVVLFTSSIFILASSGALRVCVRTNESTVVNHYNNGSIVSWYCRGAQTTDRCRPTTFYFTRQSLPAAQRHSCRWRRARCCQSNCSSKWMIHVAQNCAISRRSDETTVNVEFDAASPVIRYLT